MKVSKQNLKHKSTNRDSSLELTPVKNIQITEKQLPGGMVLIHYPVTIRPWVARVFKRLGQHMNENRNRKLQLDALGTEVWALIDGDRSVRRIIEMFASTHRFQFREAELAVTQFLRDLGRRGIIALKE
jgi:hypothetical protein